MSSWSIAPPCLYKAEKDWIMWFCSSQVLGPMWSHVFFKAFRHSWRCRSLSQSRLFSQRVCNLRTVPKGLHRHALYWRKLACCRVFLSGLDVHKLRLRSGLGQLAGLKTVCQSFGTGGVLSALAEAPRVHRQYEIRHQR